MSRLATLLQGLTLPVLFFVYGLIAIPSIAYLTPPFQVSDELSHFQRAELLTLGRVVGERRGALSGGTVSIGISTAVEPFWPKVLKPDVKASRTMFERAREGRWNTGINYTTFENTSIYPSHFYFASALGIAIGKAAKLSVVSTLYLSRLLTGFTALGPSVIAIALAGTAAPWMFALLALPMSLSSMASVSQEAMLLATAALAAALCVSNLREDRAERRRFIAMCGALAAIAMARPPYLGLAVLPLVFRGAPVRARMVGALAIVAAVLAWSLVSSKYAYVKYGIGNANAPDQITYLLQNPTQIPHIVWNTFIIDGPLLLESFIGQLGWLDLRLPLGYHYAAWAALAAALLCITGRGVPGSWRARGTVLAGLLFSAGGIFAALYLSWSPVGLHYVGGAQGRYFIPLALFVPALMPAPQSGSSRPPTIQMAGIAVMLFPAVTLAVTFASLVDRYYLS